MIVLEGDLNLVDEGRGRGIRIRMRLERNTTRWNGGLYLHSGTDGGLKWEEVKGRREKCRIGHIDIIRSGGRGRLRGRGEWTKR